MKSLLQIRSISRPSLSMYFFTVFYYRRRLFQSVLLIDVSINNFYICLLWRSSTLSSAEQCTIARHGSCERMSIYTFTFAFSRVTSVLRTDPSYTAFQILCCLLDNLLDKSHLLGRQGSRGMGFSSDRGIPQRDGVIFSSEVSSRYRGGSRGGSDRCSGEGTERATKCELGVFLAFVKGS